jgi:carbonic anhydrase
MTALLQANDEFARTAAALPLGLPRRQVVLLTCLDHRIDPAAVFGLQPGDAPVIRNAGGRVTSAVVADVAFLAFLADQLGRGAEPGPEPWLEVAVVQHTQCGTGFLADPAFRARAAEATGIPDAELAAAAVADPTLTVRADVERLLESTEMPAGVTVSGHVHDLNTGRVTTVVPARTSNTAGDDPLPYGSSDTHGGRHA